MPRLPRKLTYEESNVFHILVQGIAKSYIFRADKEKSVYLQYLNEKIKNYDLFLLAYCVMGNHAHLLISADNNESISQCLYEVNKSYAKYFNTQHNRVGYVFRNRFKAEPIIGETYLLKCIEYIHNNPVKARMIASAEDYRFSSCKSYETQKGIVDFEKLSELIGNAELENNENDIEFFEDEYEGKMELEQAVDMAMLELNIQNKNHLLDEETLKTFVKIVQSKTKVSLRKMADILGINRERLRILMSRVHDT